MIQRRVMELAQKIHGQLVLERHDCVVELLAPVHPADIAEVLRLLPDDERMTVQSLLTDEQVAQVVEQMDYEDQVRTLTELGSERAARVLDEMSSDDAADLLGGMPEEVAGRFLQLMETQEAEDVKGLLDYDEDTAGGIMTTEYVALSEQITAQEAIETLRRLAPDAETAYYVYVVGPGAELVGVLSLRDLVVAPPSTPINQIMNRNVIKVLDRTDQEEVARVVQRYDLLAVPVVDERNTLLGIVTVDDVIDVIEEESEEDLLRVAAAMTSERERDGRDLLGSVRNRLPWLLALLFGGMLSARVISGFSTTLESLTVLAFFMPVLADGGGNVASQSLVLVIRGLATGELDRRRAIRVVLDEALVGLLVGLASGALLATLASLWQGSLVVGLIVGITLVVNMFIAALIGSLMPLALERLGVDPAVASGPLVTTLMDVTGFSIYFSIATFVITRVL